MFVIRPMRSEDIVPTAVLFEEMQAHYRVACPPLDDIASRLGRLPEGVDLMIAADPDIVGFAAVGTIFPGPGLESGLFLKELFVSSRARGRGAGTALLRAVARLAVERGFARIDWTADRSNERLLGFYRAMGAVEQEEKVFLRLAGPAVAELAAEGELG